MERPLGLRPLVQGHELPEISINVSSLQLRQPGFCERINEALQCHAVDQLDLEITEGSLIENIDDAIEIVSRVHALGVTSSIDDPFAQAGRKSLLQSYPRAARPYVTRARPPSAAGPDEGRGLSRKHCGPPGRRRRA